MFMLTIKSRINIGNSNLRVCDQSRRWASIFLVSKLQNMKLFHPFHSVGFDIFGF